MANLFKVDCDICGKIFDPDLDCEDRDCDDPRIRTQLFTVERDDDGQEYITWDEEGAIVLLYREELKTLVNALGYDLVKKE